MGTNRTCEEIAEALARLDQQIAATVCHVNGYYAEMDERPEAVADWREASAALRALYTERSALHTELGDPDERRVFIRGVEVTKCPACGKAVEYETECEDCGKIGVCRDCGLVGVELDEGRCEPCMEKALADAEELARTDADARRWFEFRQ